MSKTVMMAATTIALILTTASQAANNNDAHLRKLESQLEQLQQQLELTADAVEQSNDDQRTTVGGYGELHYNHLDKAGDRKRSIDFHRFVLFVGHEFDEQIRFFSELELEHSLAGEGQPGEVELEQAFVEFDLDDTTRIRGGLFMVPVGILNETHEPPTFYGVERNPVEKHIIPATWWEAGAAVAGQIGNRGLSYDLALTSGLAVDPAKVEIRGGRQKVAKANASQPAISARLRYTGMAGLALSGSLFYQGDISQRSDDDLGAAILMEANAVWRHGPFGVRALFARWDIDGTAATNTGKETQTGYYLEASYKVTPRVGLFARHDAWSVKDGVEATQQNVGIHFWPHEDVVIKADLQQQNDDAGDADGFNLGIGYQF